ncbi:agmatinase [bacterium]|nr:agmatinase [bacterium]
MTGDKGVFFQPMVAPEDADCIILGLPWDGTVSNRPGARFGPEAVRSATLGVEDYSPYLDRDISEIRIFDAGDIELPFGDSGAALESIRGEYARFSGYHGKPVTLGGEHLVSWPLVQEMHKRYGDDLFVIQLDAHADLRTDYLGVKYSHATVMNMITGLIGKENTAVIGVRSGTRDEWQLLRAHPHCFGGASTMPVDAFGAFASEELKNRSVYVTFDLDVFDPSILPGTGTPEPGGILFREFVELVQIFDSLPLVGADIVELAPDYDNSGISGALAATVLRELLLVLGKMT